MSLHESPQEQPILSSSPDLKVRSLPDEKYEELGQKDQVTKSISEEVDQQEDTLPSTAGQKLSHLAQKSYIEEAKIIHNSDEYMLKSTREMLDRRKVIFREIESRQDSNAEQQERE